MYKLLQPVLGERNDNSDIVNVGVSDKILIVIVEFEGFQFNDTRLFVSAVKLDIFSYRIKPGKVTTSLSFV